MWLVDDKFIRHWKPWIWKHPHFFVNCAPLIWKVRSSGFWRVRDVPTAMNLVSALCWRDAECTVCTPILTDPSTIGYHVSYTLYWWSNTQQSYAKLSHHWWYVRLVCLYRRFRFLCSFFPYAPPLFLSSFIPFFPTLQSNWNPRHPKDQKGTQQEMLSAVLCNSGTFWLRLKPWQPVEPRPSQRSRRLSPQKKWWSRQGMLLSKSSSLNPRKTLSASWLYNFCLGGLNPIYF